ncbi:MAG TPA: hypothetical protein VGM10_15275 [Actinocrinis sp.]|jgi:hypothetical protein
MRPVYADFSADPPRLGNAALLAPGGARPGGKAAFGAGPRLRFGGNHVKLDAGGGVALGFDAGASTAFDEATLTVTALASKRGPRPGRAPLRVTVNGKALVADWTIPGGGDLPQEMSFAVPADWLTPGPDNRIELSNAPDAATFLWLYRVTLEEVFDRGAAARALAAEGARAAVLAYDTEVGIAQGGAWTPGPRLHVYIERGEQSLPAQLSWSDASGAEAAISFHAAMDGLHGYRRAADGTTTQLRGRLARRAEYPGGIEPGALLHFAETEEEWGGAWHRSGPLRLMLAHGEHAARRIAWRDQRGNCASISLQPDRSGFLGYYQRHNEGPIGYRGRAGHDAEKY